MCADDVVCEVAAVEAVCEDILKEAELENFIDYNGRKKRDVTSISKPDDEKIKRWIYWERNSKEIKPRSRTKRAAYFTDEETTNIRVKRQFGFVNDILKPKDSGKSKEEIEKKNREDNNYMGVMIDLMMKNLGSDIGAVHLSSFLENLEDKRSTSNSYGINNLLTEYSKEFGNEKAKSLKILARSKLKQFDIPELKEDLDESFQSDSIVFPDNQDQDIQNFLKKSLKLKFKVAGKLIHIL